MWPFASPLTLNGWVSRTKPICWDLSGLGSPENQWSANRYPATIFDHVLTETVYRYRYPLHPFLFVKSVRRVVKLELIYANFILVAKSHMDPCSFYIISYIHTYTHTYRQTYIHTYIYIFKYIYIYLQHTYPPFPWLLAQFMWIQCGEILLFLHQRPHVSYFHPDVSLRRHAAWLKARSRGFRTPASMSVGRA